MSRVLIDLTDLELWSGHHGGIQRVVYGIAKNYYLQHQDGSADVVFMSFSSKDKTFHESSFEPIFQRVETAKDQPTTAAAAPAVSLKSRLKQRIRPYVPESVAKSPVARKAAISSLKIAAKAYRYAKNAQRTSQQQSTVVSAPKIDFSAQDTVLILGKPWDNLDIQATLTKERAVNQFKLVQVVYDLIICLHPHLHHPSLFVSYTKHMFEAITASDLLLAISESSANDLREFCRRLQITPPPIEVIRLGDEILAEPKAGVSRPDPRINERFIACIGTIEIRKNHMLLYYAYKLARQQEIELPQLVIVGGRGWLSGDLQYLIEHDPAIREKIIILDNVSDDGLSWIYQNCQFTVYPSMYEGWGLPVAESLAYGKPVLASSASSVPEIAGKLVEYFSPYSPEECLKGLRKYEEARVLARAADNIRKTYKITTWQDTYRQVASSLKRFTAGKR